MKNKLFKGLFGFLAVLFLFVVTDVYAVDSETLGSVTEGSNSLSQNVTIGEVETPVYEVVIIWQDLTYDWVYDEGLKEFAWRKPATCEPYPGAIEYAFAHGTELYKDSSCSERAYEGDAVEEYYWMYNEVDSVIGIEDMSQNGQIVPSVSWESSEKYGHVIGEFSYLTEMNYCGEILDQDMLDAAIEESVTLYEDSECSNLASNNPTTLDKTYYAYINYFAGVPITGEVPDDGRLSYAGSTGAYNFTESSISIGDKFAYKIYFSLRNDETKEATTPVAGDVIGAVTISIRAR